MIIVNRVLVETFHIVERELDRRNLGGTESKTTSQAQQTTTTSSSPAATTTSSSSGGGTSSPLLFFVALGFGVVFTNLWIIVGVKYCFRYNARNRALRNGEEANPINLENMPTRPHRRRREKKLMTMDEVNERFPLTKYKTWVASRESEGLPTTGGVTAPPTAPPTRPASLRDVDDIPSSPADTKHSIGTRPATANTDEAVILPVANADVRKSMDTRTTELEKGITPTVEEQNHLEHVRTTASTVDKHQTSSSDAEDDDDDDDDDHIHTAVPPELLTNPGDSCAICIDALAEDDDIRGLTCGHAFHASCVDPWLTGRRACCPLCKADYFVPKPRPEGEAEAHPSGRRRTAHPPPSAFGLRSTYGMTRGIGLPGRFASRQPESDERRARREAAALRAAGVPTTAEQDAINATADAEAAAPSRWRPRFGHPFGGVHMPHLPVPGATRQADTSVAPVAPVAAPSTATPAPEPSPSQLEAGTAVVR